MCLRKCLPFAVIMVLYALDVSGSARNVNRDQMRLIRAKIDQDVNPCIDFHQYACGKWDQVHPTEEYFETIGLIDYRVNRDMARQLKRIKYTPEKSLNFVKKALSYYKACTTLSELDINAYLDYLEKVENFPINEWLYGEEEWHTCDWIKLLATMRKYEMNGILIEEIMVQNPKDSLLSNIDLDMPVISGSLKPLEKKHYLIILKYLGLEESRSWVRFWQDIVAFESKVMKLEEDLANADDSENEENIQTRITTFGKLKPSWLKEYLRALFGHKIKSDTIITTQHETYLREIYHLVETQPKGFIARYLTMRFIWHLHLTMPNSFKKTHCVAHTRSVLPLAMQFLYEKSHPKLVEQYADVEKIFKNLIQSFNSTLLSNVNHFSPDILDFLRSKLEAQRLNIGNLPRNNTINVLEDYYSNLHVNQNNFYFNHLNVMRFSFDKYHEFRDKRQTNQPEEFFHLQDRETAINSSPYYLARYNMIVVPTSLLHLPIYDAAFFDIFKYSSFGFILSHEIIHGFDLSGLQFDQLGNIQGPSDAILANSLFDAKLDCLHKGNENVIDEKIADVSGLRLCYNLYFGNAKHSERAERTFLSKDFNVEQLFFLNFAQFFCGSTANDYSQTLTEHGSDHQRLNDALANFEKFAEAFHCPLGSPMNPFKKCHIWR